MLRPAVALHSEQHSYATHPIIEHELARNARRLLVCSRRDRRS